MTALLSVQNLSIFKGEDCLVHQLSFEVAHGELVAILGESGVGKTLAMLSLIGMTAPELVVQGQIVMDSEPIPKYPKDHTGIRGQKIAYLFQDPQHLFNPVHTIKTAFRLIFNHLSLPKAQHYPTAIHLLTQVGLPNPSDFLTRYPHQLSGGEAQRISLALVLALDPMLIIADEPTSNLDNHKKDEILALLRGLADGVRSDGTRRAVVVISHDVASICTVADRYVLMAKSELGSVVAEQGRAREFDEKRFLAGFGKPLPFDESRPVVLNIKNLSLAYQRSWWGKQPVIHHLNFTLKQGQIIGLVGRSGQGKSSIAKAITRLDERIVVTGEILFGRVNVLTLTGKALARYRPKILLVMQDVASSLSPSLTIKESLIEGLTANHRHIDDDKLLSLLDFLKLPKDILACYPARLSGGEQGRVCLLRALLLTPEVLILDEPTAMLDAKTSVQVLDLLRAINQQFGVAMLIISHDRQVVEAVCHDVVVLGRVD